MKQKPGRPPKNTTYTIPEAGSYVGCCADTIRNWIKRGILDSFQSERNKHHRIRRIDLEPLKHHWERGTMRLVFRRYREQRLVERKLPVGVEIPSAPPVKRHVIDNVAKRMGISESYLRTLIAQTDILKIYLDDSGAQCLLYRDIEKYVSEFGGLLHYPVMARAHNGTVVVAYSVNAITGLPIEEEGADEDLAELTLCPEDWKYRP